jgi:hypothetical protein
MRTLLLIAIVTSTAGCLGSALAPSGGAGGSGSGAGGSGSGAGGSGSSGGADMALDVAAMFDAEIAPMMTASCGVCHAAVGPTNAPVFMAPTPDILTNVLAFGGLIGDVPEDSMLYTKGNHEGPAFTPAQLVTLHDWIVAYNASKTAAVGGGDGGVAGAAPVVKPFAPSLTAANSIDLSLFNAKLAGMTLTFTAKMVGTSIQLSALTLKASATVGIHAVHPLFTTYDTTGVATDDPIDSFAGLDETVNPNTSAALGPGTLVLPSFPTGGLITVNFDKLETATGTVATSTGCKALAMFVANVKPLLQANCNSCHVGANPTAGLAFDATPDAQLCINALSEVNTVTPANSNMLKKPDGSANGDAAHPKKINPFTAYQTAVTNWINAEK